MVSTCSPGHLSQFTPRLCHRPFPFPVDESIDIGPSAVQRHYVSTHEAMATEFRLFLDHPDRDYAARAAQASWELVDSLENELSIYIESSALSRLNAASPGSELRLPFDAYQCLLLAEEVRLNTGGSFCASTRFAQLYSDLTTRSGLPPGPVQFFREQPVVHLLLEDPQIDLGGIGKGYAIDRVAALLREWEVPGALISAGGSTHYALCPANAPGGWELRLRGTRTSQNFELINQAISGSGTAVKGEHIHPGAQTGRQAGHLRTWAIADTGAWSDALSTAFFNSTIENIREICRQLGTKAFVEINVEANLLQIP